ncbi:swi5-dependent recombination DNA repair protein 1 homolog isoform X2 [Nomia melanderi]|uniref:swi5-dependent recombination DNA repair protein 1 homolog isoform X2 n=1 Tax=Nomia melanderi TaxID=2448451 RepID=UPI001303FFAB|nr:swi5-dependent recombination DNA repair protein 1 homolog isoform X2 [Nomia melanderi]
MLRFLQNMSTKPYRNSKGVDKPFRSPFSTPKNKNTEINVNTPKSSTPVTSMKVSVPRKSLFPIPPTKKVRLSTVETADQSDVEQNEKLCHDDLETLRKRIREKQVAINQLKTTLLYKRKNKTEDLENAIEKWTKVCQTALEDYQNDWKEQNGESVSIMNILSSLGIDPKVIRFSPDDDTFY